jgi:hypothetical protein
VEEHIFKEVERTINQKEIPKKLFEPQRGGVTKD